MVKLGKMRRAHIKMIDLHARSLHIVLSLFYHFLLCDLGEVIYPETEDCSRRIVNTLGKLSQAICVQCVRSLLDDDFSSRWIAFACIGP